METVQWVYSSDISTSSLKDGADDNVLSCEQTSLGFSVFTVAFL